MNNTYTTMSLNVAAYLKGNGIKVLKVEVKDEKVLFHFEKSEKVKMLVDMYLNDSAFKRFIMAFKEIKVMVYDIHHK